MKRWGTILCLCLLPILLFSACAEATAQVDFVANKDVKKIFDDVHTVGYILDDIRKVDFYKEMQPNDSYTKKQVKSTKLDTTVYTVVGIVHNANYFSFEREPASVGNGTVKLVFYIPQQDFAFEAYTEIYLTAEGALAQDSLGDDYRDTVDAVKARVEGIADARCEARYNGIVDEARAELDDAWAEYNDAKAEADNHQGWC